MWYIHGVEMPDLFELASNYRLTHTQVSEVTGFSRTFLPTFTDL